MQRLGPPPSFCITAAMLTATRNKGVDRTPPRGSHSVQARLRTRDEGWAVGARVGNSTRAQAGVEGGLGSQAV